MTTRTPKELERVARELVCALCLAQIGDVNDMADLEARAITERFGDPELQYAVLRLLALIVNSLAASWLADTYRDDEPFLRRHSDELAQEVIRRLVWKITFEVL